MSLQDTKHTMNGFRVFRSDIGETIGHYYFNGTVWVFETVRGSLSYQRAPSIKLADGVWAPLEYDPIVPGLRDSKNRRIYVNDRLILDSSGKKYKVMLIAETLSFHAVRNKHDHIKLRDTLLQAYPEVKNIGRN